MKEHSPRTDERRRHEPEGPDGPHGLRTAPAEEWREPEPGQLERVHRYSPGLRGHAARADVAAWLSDADFPATPYDLMRHAERMGAPDEVVTVLRLLPARRYLTIPEVSRAAGRDPAKRRW
ncbi:DUF2795 domain-containing protein [Nonomuraea sp. MCN248]|uniref:DUF2795 domain-containing protein n=1 Tax=Nonomuraea corallina TaxID=2989783 RepID=A0ABT4SM45_9ACTN|nr:DUF2795 domain-containing protein [Nonomuraea corallina]MDA0638319.1 DUF2795 domain-containing protein [Nonomuraea corallina]